MENNSLIIHTDSCTCGACPSRKRPFVNLHAHTSASLLDGVAMPSEYAKLAVKYGNPGIAITDHGNPAGLFDFYKEAKKNGLKPILGLEFYLTLDTTIKVPNKKRDLEYRDKHQTVLIKNAEGYKNFCKLTYQSFTEGYYYKPRITYDSLFENKNGLIVTSGCAASMFNQLLMNGKEKDAEEWFKKFVREFGDDFYGELQFNELTDSAKYGMNQKMINDFIIAMCKKYHVPMIIGGDTHYATKEDAKLQDILIACQRRKDGPAEEQAAESFIHARHLYYQSSEDYYQFNKDFGYNYEEAIITDALDNSVALLSKVNFEFETNKINFPKFNVPPTHTSATELLTDLAFSGLAEKLEKRIERGEVELKDKIDEYSKRLDYEIQVVNDKQVSDYFLIVRGLINWCKSTGIASGTGRGSGAGALLTYALDITEVDPIKHGLLFERFLNPERTAMPDLDLDFANGSREAIREYLKSIYGNESVIGVGTHSIYAAKSSIQDVSRGLGKDTSMTSVLMTEITKLDNLEDQTNLIEYFDKVKTKCSLSVAKWIQENEDTIYWADRLIGRLKNHGTHAGGILITPGPVYDHIPVTKGGKEIVTAFKEADGSTKDLSELGLLKLDVLGLKTLNVIHGSIQQIKEQLGKDIKDDITYINLENPDLYKLIRDEKLYGVFQLDGGALPLVKDIQPTQFDDIVAISSLNRPGPKETFGPIYAKWKRHFENGTPEKCKDDKEIFPRLDFMQKITQYQYNCMIHQEDFMFMVKEAADFNLGEADNFRRAIAWREDHPKYHTVKKYFDTLREKMLAKGYSEDDVTYFVDYCRKFSGYSFNRSHSCAYAYIALQCAYLKCYYPAFFYANLANVEDHEVYQEIISHALNEGIKVLPISLHKLNYNFTVENGAIRIGMKALKGFGAAAYEKLKALYELVEVPTLNDILNAGLNKASIQALIDVNAFDYLGVKKEQVEILSNLYKDKKIATWFTRKKGALSVELMPASLLIFPENICLSIAEQVKEKENPHLELISQLAQYINYTPLTEREVEDREIKLLGFSLSLPKKLDALEKIISENPDYNLLRINQWSEEDDLILWYCSDVSIGLTKNQKQYLNIEAIDKTSKVKIKCWSKVALERGKAYVSHLKKDKWGITLVVDNFLTELNLKTNDVAADN